MTDARAVSRTAIGTSRWDDRNLNPQSAVLRTALWL